MKLFKTWMHRILAGVLSAGIFLSARGIAPHIHTLNRTAEAAGRV